MSASTRYAVLGLVARRPTYGYALLQQLRRWSVEPSAVRSSSVYTALTRLEQDALIEPLGPSNAAGTDRQPRLTYGATPAGEERFAQWLATPPSSYDDLRLRIALARPQDLPTVIGFVIAAEEAACNAFNNSTRRRSPRSPLATPLGSGRQRDPRHARHRRARRPYRGGSRSGRSWRPCWTTRTPSPP